MLAVAVQCNSDEIVCKGQSKSTQLEQRLIDVPFFKLVGELNVVNKCSKSVHVCRLGLQLAVKRIRRVADGARLAILWCVSQCCVQLELSQGS